MKSHLGILQAIWILSLTFLTFFCNDDFIFLQEKINVLLELISPWDFFYLGKPFFETKKKCLKFQL